MLSNKNKNKDLPIGLYFWMPLLLTVSPYLLQWIFGEKKILDGEHGIFEILTFLFLVIALYFILRGRVSAIALQIGRLPVWLLILFLGSVYFAGEEISWGQHFFLWETSPTWKNLNGQKETNLHNIHAVFNEWPRAIMTLSALFGGILIPLYRRLRSIDPPVNEMAGWLWPSGVCVPVCFFSLIVSPIDKFMEKEPTVLSERLNISGGEMKECLLALFILVYAMSLFKRLQGAAKTNPAHPKD